LARDSHLKATGGANVRNQAMRERLDGVERKLDALSASVDRRFEAVDRRFEAVDRRFDAVDRRFDAVDQRFDAVDQRFDAVDQRFDRLEVRSQVQVEEFRALVQRAAEGYGATLEHITRRLDEIHDVVTGRLSGHDAVLKNHATRIDALERR
jgi:tetrahydromethanopterin S-methyltransferase subunit G